MAQIPRGRSPCLCGMLLSIALGPLVVRMVAHPLRKGGGLLGDTDLGGLIAVTGLSAASRARTHMALEYLPFILYALRALYRGGRDSVEGQLHVHRCQTTAILALGAAIASIIGTRGLDDPIGRSFAPIARAASIPMSSSFSFFSFRTSRCFDAARDPPLFLGFLKGSIFSGPCAPCGQRLSLRLLSCC